MKIDFTYLETISDGDNDFIIQFIETYEQTINSLVDKMDSELAGSDFINLGKTAHQLKPSAKMIGLSSGSLLEELQDNPDNANTETLSFIRRDCFDGLEELKKWAKEKGAE